VAVAMRAGPVNVVESTASVIKADDAPAQDSQVTSPDLQTPSQSAMGAAVDVVATTTPAPLDAAVIPSIPSPPTVAANEPVPDAPQPMTDSSMFGTPHRSARYPSKLILPPCRRASRK